MTGNGGTPRRVPERRPERPPQKRQQKTDDKSPLLELLSEYLSPAAIKENLRRFFAYLGQTARGVGMSIFYSRERFICGAVCAVLMIIAAMLQTTVFSTIRPFGGVPDILLTFVIALAVTEGERWGAVWGIVCAVVIESLGTAEPTALPFLYMLCGYAAGALCRSRLTEGAAVRALLTVSSLVPRALLTAVLALTGPLTVTFSDLMTKIVLPEAGATLLLAAPVHFITYLCVKPFHHTRAEMVERRKDV